MHNKTTPRPGALLSAKTILQIYWPKVEGLKEVLVIKNGEVIPLWP
jgi:hypothetical protein